MDTVEGFDKRYAHEDVPLIEPGSPRSDSERNTKQDHQHHGSEGTNEQAGVIAVLVAGFLEEAGYGQFNSNHGQATSQLAKCLWEGHIVDGVGSGSEDLVSRPNDFALAN